MFKDNLGNKLISINGEKINTLYNEIMSIKSYYNEKENLNNKGNDEYYEQDFYSAINNHFTDICELVSIVENSLFKSNNPNSVSNESFFEEKKKSLSALYSKNEINDKDILQYETLRFQSLKKIEEIEELINKKTNNFHQYVIQKENISRQIKELNHEYEMIQNEIKLFVREDDLNEMIKTKKQIKNNNKILKKLQKKILENEDLQDKLEKCDQEISNLSMQNNNLSIDKINLEVEITEKSEKLSTIENEIERMKNIKIIEKNKKIYKEYQSKQITLENDLNKLNLKIKDFDNEELESNLKELTEKKIEHGKTEQAILSITKEIKELEKNPPNSEENAINLYIEVELLEQAINEQTILLKYLESSIIAFHNQKIFQINSIIAKL